MATVLGFINSTQYDIFPSSNSTGTGKITSERNVQTLTAKLGIPSYKSQASDFTLQYDGSDLTITAGKANINGYWLELNSQVTASFVLASDGDYYVSFTLMYDIANLLASDESGICKCIALVVDTTEPADTDLILGTVTKDGVTYSATTNDKNIYAFSLDVIPSPDGTDTLQNFLDDIPNQYVSKVNNDTKSGNLAFKDSSNNTVVSIDPNSQPIVVTQDTGSSIGSTIVWGGGIELDNTNAAEPMPIEAKNLVLRDASWTNRVEITSSGIKAIGNRAELPYTTYFGPVVGSFVKNVLVTIGSNGESPSISTPDSNLQINVKSGSGTANISGNLTVSGDIHANRVYNAVFNGFGEIFRRDKEEVIEYGDVVCIGPDGLVHRYDSLKYDRTSIIGVCSDTIGYMLGGEDIPEDERVEVELVGQIWIKTNEVNIIPGSIVAVDVDGTVRKTNIAANKFGVALTNVIDGKVRVLYNGH